MNQVITITLSYQHKYNKQQQTYLPSSFHSKPHESVTVTDFFSDSLTGSYGHWRSQLKLHLCDRQTHAGKHYMSKLITTLH